MVDQIVSRVLNAENTPLNYDEVRLPFWTHGLKATQPIVCGTLQELKIELLRLATLLIKFMTRELTAYRKELIKFAWNYLKAENSSSKHWAYVNVCRFVDAYDTPPKIVLQVPPSGLLCVNLLLLWN